MKIYIAAKFARREDMRPMRDAIWDAGHEVVSTWIDEVKRPEGMDSETFKKKLAIKDVAEVFSADLLILDTAFPSETGGKEVEFGIALGRFQTKLIWIVGPKRNVFHELADRTFPTWDLAIMALRWISPSLKERIVV